MTNLPTAAELNSALIAVNKKVMLGLNITHISYALLLLIISWAHFQITANSFALWIFKIIPLLIFIPGFMKQKYRSYSWICFAVLPYFIWIVPMALGRGTWSDWSITTLLIIVFNAAMMASRWMQQQSYLQWQIANTPTTNA